MHASIVVFKDSEDADIFVEKNISISKANIRQKRVHLKTLAKNGGVQSERIIGETLRGMCPQKLGQCQSTSKIMQIIWLLHKCFAVQHLNKSALRI